MARSFSSFEDCRRKFMRAGCSRKEASNRCSYIFSEGARGTKPSRKKKGGLR